MEKFDHNYIVSGQYELDIKAVVENAMDLIRKELSLSNFKSAVVIDIDETILSNYPYILKYGSLSDLRHFSNWQKLSLCEPIKPVVEFYQWLVSNSVNVFFVTARPTDLQTATLFNLEKYGINKWEQVFFRDNLSWPIPKLFKKATRQGIISSGFDIIVNIGDQPTDLEGGFAQNHLKIPNPFYLESNLPWKQKENSSA